MKSTSGGFVDQQAAAVEHHLQGWLATATHVWEKVCAFDGISSPTLVQFAIFSSGNPWVPFYNYALVQYQQTYLEASAGGYVGLSIHQGRARVIR